MPSSAIAKKMRGEVRIDPSNVLNVATITTIATKPHPGPPDDQLGRVRRHERRARHLPDRMR